MKKFEHITKEELIASLLEAPVPLSHFDDPNMHVNKWLQDIDYTKWYEYHVVPLIEIQEGEEPL